MIGFWCWYNMDSSGGRGVRLFWGLIVGLCVGLCF